MKKFLAIMHARNMEFFRDRGTFIWNLLFPLFLVFGFAFAFGGDGEDLFNVGTVGEAPQSLEFTELDHINFVPYDDLDEGLERLRFHQVDLLVDFRAADYYVNEESTNGYMSEQLFAAMAGENFSRRTVSGQPIRYVDWFVPGLIGMNIMFSGLFGVGFVLVRYRKNGVLKRLKATPVSPLEFVSAQVASRFLIVFVSSVVVFAGANAFLNFMMRGSYLNLVLVAMLGIICMISLGLVFASRIRTEELASGLINLLLWPMIILSGVFFSLEGTPEFMQVAAGFLPLTHFIGAARGIMLEGAGFVEIMPNLLALTGFTGGFLVLASLLFRWE